MSLWNNIKDWFDNEEPQQKPEQRANEILQVAEQQSVEELFEQMCLENSVTPENLRKTKAVQLFCDWYVGPADRVQIGKCYEQFKSAHPIIQKKFGDVEIV